MSPDEKLEDRLRYILGFVDGHVKFAETKNAALLVLNTGVVAGAVQLLAGDVILSSWFSGYLVVLAAGNLVSGLIALLSFLPITSLTWYVKRGECTDSDSLLFFGDCQKYGVKSYLAALYKDSGLESPFSRLHRMYAEQVISNSRIAWRKFSYFRVAIWATVCGVLTPPVGVILFILVTRYDSVLESS